MAKLKIIARFFATFLHLTAISVVGSPGTRALLTALIPQPKQFNGNVAPVTQLYRSRAIPG